MIDEIKEEVELRLMVYNHCLGYPMVVPSHFARHFERLGVKRELYTEALPIEVPSR